MPETNKIGLLGGTFDPLHLGHLIIAESVLNDLNLDKIYFIPAHKHALKSNLKITSSEIRLQMLETALNNFEYFDISDIELKHSKISYTIDTLNKFREYHNLPSAKLYYIIGYDNLGELHLWKDYEKIMEIVQIVVAYRTADVEEKTLTNFKKNIILLSTPIIDISSTAIRDRIKNNDYWKCMVLPETFQFIEENNLYK